MKKNIILPIVICAAIAIVVLSKCLGSSGKIVIECQKDTTDAITPILTDSIELKVYVENSGSMDGYMCAGSNLKDAVFDYVSDLKKRQATTCSLNYINSKIIPYNGDLRSFIKNLSPESFARAGGNRGNTDLMQIFETIMKEQGQRTVSVFVSDCILDIPENAIDYLGNCQVSIKNTFNEAIKNNPQLGVEIIKLESKFDGYWYCGKNKELLKDAKRPYYIWLIGDRRYLADFNKEVPVKDVIGGIREYCAYAPSQSISFDIGVKSYVVHKDKISINLLVDLRGSLQAKSVLEDVKQIETSHPQVIVLSIREITDSKSLYSHVIELEIDDPAKLSTETITFSYPELASWVLSSDDTTGLGVNANLDKTTGLKALITGVSLAYKNSANYGSVTFNMKNR